MPDAAAPRLTKSRFVTGWQCHRLLWWTVHEPAAQELKPDKVLEDRFDQGRHVTALAQRRFPGATMIPPRSDAARIEATRLALDFGAPTVLEAAFSADGVFVAADVLLREGDGFALMEVKAATKAKPEHVPDVAVQVYVARKCGVNVRRAAVMHLNPEFRHPDAGDLFAETDITREVEGFIPQVPARIAQVHGALAGPLPDVPIGLQCFEPWECRLHDRCWPDDPWHISMLYNVGGRKTDAYLRTGIHSIRDLPPETKLSEPQRRQIAALEEAARRSSERGLTINFRQADLETAELGAGSYDLILNINYLQRSLVPPIRKALVTGGHVLFETYLLDQQAIGHPKNPAYLLQRGELLGLFSDFRVFYYREGKFTEAEKDAFRAGLFGQKIS